MIDDVMLFLLVVVAIVVENLRMAWDVAWAGLWIPLLDWIRYGLFWRFVEKMRSLGRSA